MRGDPMVCYAIDTVVHSRSMALGSKCTAKATVDGLDGDPEHFFWADGVFILELSFFIPFHQPVRLVDVFIMAANATLAFYFLVLPTMSSIFPMALSAKSQSLTLILVNGTEGAIVL